MSFGLTVLLLGRNAECFTIVVTPAAPLVAPGGTIAFAAAPGVGADALVLSPASPASVSVSGTRLFTVGGS